MLPIYTPEGSCSGREFVTNDVIQYEMYGHTRLANYLVLPIASPGDLGPGWPTVVPSLSLHKALVVFTPPTPHTHTQ